MAKAKEAEAIFKIVEMALGEESVPFTPLEDAIVRSWWRLAWRGGVVLSNMGKLPGGNAAVRKAETTATLKLTYYVAGVTSGKFPNPLAVIATPQASAAV